MLGAFSSWLDFLLRAGTIAIILNEIRGLVLAVPVIYGIFQTGGTAIGIWVGLCSLGGIGLSVVVPIFISRKIRQRFLVAS